MKTLSSLLITVCLTMGGTFAASAQSYSNLWKQVEEAQEKGLPQTVAGLADRIFRKAEREGQAGQLFKAYAVRTYYQQTITPDSIYSDLAAMEQWAVRETNPVNRAVLHTLLAQLYGEYARRNGMQLNRRTNLELTATQVPADIRRWSGRQFVQQVSAHVTAMLKEQEALLATSSRDYIPYIIQGETGRYFGHDMFRLLTGYALRALNDVKDVDTGDTTKAFIASLRQQRADAYRNKPDRQDALVLILADDYDGNVSALDSLIRIYGAQDVCAELYLSKATTLRHGRRNVEALKACDEAIARYPRYPRINELRNQRAIILKPYLFIYTDMTCYPGDSVNLTVRHNNLDGFELLTMQQGHVLSRRHFDLKRPADYMTEDSVFRFAVPTRPGKYTLQLTEKWNKDYDIGDLCVTRLKAISIGWGGKNYEVKVVDSKSGQPVGDARVEFYNANDSLLTVRTTDADGRVMLEWPASSTRRNNVVQLRATKGSDTGMALQRMGGYIDYSWQSREEENVQLLTDRPIYRPGQTIYIKGVAYRQRGDTAAVRTDAPFTVTLRDVNGKEIATTTVRTGDFGSFATQFTLPAACLNGGYTIDASPSGSRTLVQVEEYKRPTFEVTFDTLKTTYRLGDTVQLSGRVMSFSGVPVQDVLLQYRVNCSVFLYMPLRDDYRSNFELLTDSVRVGEDGRFRFPLVLKNDEVGLDGIGEDTYYRFLYKVAADVTNLSGETQSAATDIVVGNRSMTLSFAGGDGQLICKEDTTRYLHFDALNLNGQPIDVKGTYTLTKKGELAPTMQGTFVANHPTPVTQWEQLPTGEYELRLSANDSQGREVKHVTTLTLFSYYDNRPAATKEMWTYTLNNRFDASRPAQFNFGTSLADVHVQMDVFRLGKHLESRTFQLTDSVVRFEVPYKEEYGDGITYLFAFVKNGTLHQQSIPLYKRDPDRTLRLKWTVFRDKLRPGQQEEWRLTVTTPQGTPADAELLAQMYDASLDKLYSRNKVFRVSYQRFVPNMSWSSDYVRNLNVSRSFRSRSFTAPRLEYDRLYDPSGIFGMFSGAAEIPAARDMVGVRSMAFRKSVVMNDVAYDAEEEVMEEEVYDVGVHLVDPASLRTNFSETAFFYPQLRTNADGEVVITFTLPESLTRWNFFGYAHTRDMLTGMLKGTATASKEFMLQPNLPRFVRVGDDTSMAATVTNLTAKEITGDVRLELFDPMSDKVIARQRQRFRAAAGKTTAVGFHFTATDKYQLLGVRLVADGGDFSDGEQHVLPVLSNSIYLTETLTMPIRGNESRTFALDTLFNRNSRTATNRRLTVEFTGNPAWSAVQSLPALSQPMQDNATAYAVTYYANTLAAHVLNSTPRIKAVLDSWRQSGNKEAFLSTLQQNQELKNILLEESPWLLEATNEAEQRSRLATLFDVNNLTNNNLTALMRLGRLQGSDGSWSWYKGMPGSASMTAYITGLLVRLTTLTGQPLPADAQAMQQKAFGYLHTRAAKEYADLLRSGVKETYPSSAALEYLYLVALSGTEVPTTSKAAYDHFLSLVPALLTQGNMGLKARAAIILQKAGKAAQARDFIASIKEHLSHTDERGASFAFYETPYLWGMLPVTLHTEAMEALRLAGGNDTLLEEMKIWLLKQKQATSWNSPVATADAVYALLCGGQDLLASHGTVGIAMDKKPLAVSPLIPGMGYVKETFTEGMPEVKTKEITVTKPDAGIAYGAVYAQYLSPIADVRSHGGELKVEKQLYVERTPAGGKRELQLVTDRTVLQTGDKVTSHITITLDRAMDFVQLKDQRGACFEPIGALSGYVWQRPIGYYVEVEDAATNFFFDSLPKGVYVLEYSYRTARSGRYEGGIATLQSAYAPEYAAHSAGQRLLSAAEIRN